MGAQASVAARLALFDTGAATSVKRNVRNVDVKTVVSAKRTRELLHHIGRNALHLAAAIARQVDVRVIIDGVIRGCAMADMRMRHQPDLFEHLKRTIDRGQIHAARMPLHFREQFLRSSMAQRLDGLQYELPLWRDAVAVRVKPAVPVELAHAGCIRIQRWACSG